METSWNEAIEKVKIKIKEQVNEEIVTVNFYSFVFFLSFRNGLLRDQFCDLVYNDNVYELFFMKNLYRKNSPESR